MKKIIFSTAIFAAFFILSHGDVFACSCVPMPENVTIGQQIKEAHKQSSVVFIGEVIEVVKKPDDDFFVTVKFKVEKIWNDKEFQRELVITTGRDDGFCGYAFEKGKRYLVYAFENNNELSTNICTRTSAAEQNKDIAFLNRMKKPKIKSSPK